MTIVVDEAHCVVQRSPDFRRAVLEIKQLSGLFPDAHVRALTATATRKMQDEIAKSLAMASPVVVSSNIDRLNIRIDVCKRPPTTGSGHTVEDSYNFIFTPLVKDLEILKVNFLKTHSTCSGIEEALP